MAVVELRRAEKLLATFLYTYLRVLYSYATF